MSLSADLASDLVELILPSLHREYPNKIAHVLRGDDDVRPPRELTPVFYGCFDWHSAVHSHWALARLARLRPDVPRAQDLRGALEKSFDPEKVTGERSYLAAEERRGFEMPYGMAWLLALCAELRAAPDDPDFARWLKTLEPLESLAADRFAAWIPRLTHPIRTGEHTQSAFAMGLVFDWAPAAGRRDLADLVSQRARDFYGGDERGPLGYEPSAYDFLSPCLAEADLLARVLEPARFADWLARFLPSIEIEPVTPADRADGKLVHLDGLNLSRAWMLRRIARALPEGDERPPRLRELADAHERAGLEGVRPDHYAGAHWLGSFALYALTS